jgi:hypothetical protein
LGPVTCECSLLVTYYGTLGRPNPYWLKIIFGVKRNSPFNVSTFAFMTPVYCDYNYSICISSRGNYYTHHIDLLAYRDIQSQRTRIPILEIIQISIAYSAQLISHRLPGCIGQEKLLINVLLPSVIVNSPRSPETDGALSQAVDDVAGELNCLKSIPPEPENV